ncbi:CYTH and CHAD domain-containing protein [Streptomyces sp. 4N509B]|uniref:CYTH and CHAD domain-containing protein n=1 Tax=Streptomyces sp. 4N509B TaxID=3457413 RepID=UPI003FD1AED1
MTAGTELTSSTETERKYEVSGATAPDPTAPDPTALAAALTGAGGVAGTRERDTVQLTAVYYDTHDQRLAAAGITLRRRSGGDDAGWHLKIPQPGAAGAKEEIRAPLGSPTPPASLASLVRSRTRRAELRPVLRLRTERARRELRDEGGAVLAELAVDQVTAERAGTGRTVAWTEVELELAQGVDPALLDVLHHRLTAAGLTRSAVSSKLHRALAETAVPGPGATERETGPHTERGQERAWEREPEPETEPAADPKPNATKPKAKAKARPEPEPEPKSTSTSTSTSKKAATAAPADAAGDHVLAYARRQLDALLTLDPAARRELPDAVHRMRVAVRRLRSCLATHRKVLDRAVTAPVDAELRWLAAELGVDRDREVLAERLAARLRELPVSLRRGPLSRRLRLAARSHRSDSRRRLLAVLDSERYLTLLDTLDAVLLTAPPLRKVAARPARPVLDAALRRDLARLTTRVESALAAPEGPDRDTALHSARKAAKRARYAAEAATPALGTRARTHVRQLTRVQQLLGEHQDSVLVRGELLRLADVAERAGEPSFSYGVLYQREVALAAASESELARLTLADELAPASR